MDRPTRGELERGKSFSSTQHLKSGRIVLVSNQPLAGGGWVDIQEDITEKRLAEQKIDWLARHDTLTEIANRHHFREQLEKAGSAQFEPEAALPCIGSISTTSRKSMTPSGIPSATPC